MQFRFTWVLLGSLACLALMIAMLKYGSPTRVERGNDTLHLYCAAGLRKPVQEVIERYEREFGVNVETNFDGSGKLLAEIRAGEHGDLYLAADLTYLHDAQQMGLIDEYVELASQRPCIAYRGDGRLAESGRTITGLNDLVDSRIKVSVANPNVAAVSRVAGRLLEGRTHQSQSMWDAIYQNATVTRQTVNEVANDIKTDVVDVGIVWDATAEQYEGLTIVRVPEFDRESQRIAIGVVSSTRQPSRSLHFLRYLAAKDQGLPVFDRYGYTTLDGDAWADTPEIHLFTGGLMHPAIQETIREFEQREGVRVLQTPNGCGILISQIKAGEHPDLYFACDTSFMSSVQEVFPNSTDVSRTEMVMIVAPERQAKAQIRTIQDFAAQPWKFGLCDPQHSALGDLTQRLLEEAGVWQRIQDKVVDWPSTADRLVEAVVVGGLDAAIVYQANTTRQQDKLIVIPISSARAQATQPIGVAVDSEYPHLTQRLVNQLRSGRSRDRFESLGFQWLGEVVP